MNREQALFVGFETPASGEWFSKREGVEPIIQLSDITKDLRDRLRARRSTRVLSIIADLLAMILPFLGAGLVRFGDLFDDKTLNLLGAILPIYFIVAINNRCFHLDAVVRARRGAWNAIIAFLITLSLVSLVVFFLKAGDDFSRAVFGTGAVGALALIPIFRFIAVRIGRALFGSAVASNIVIEDGVTTGHSSAILLQAAQLGLGSNLDDPVMLDRLGRLIAGAERVVVACQPERRALWADALKGADVNAELLAADIERVGAIGISSFDGERTLIVAASPLGAIDRALKRTLDLGLTMVALPLILPIMASVAIAIRLDSPGPIFFRQKRVGLGNRIFDMYKFRSMYTDLCDANANQLTTREDRRVTKVGNFIRRTSLDELPQLLNVLKGEMSIVGPRPHPLSAKAADQLYWEVDSRYRHRHSIKPGITGLAQIRGFRGNTERTEDLTNRLHADLEYLSGWSIWRDVAIIVQTFLVLRHNNAF